MPAWASIPCLLIFAAASPAQQPTPAAAGGGPAPAFVVQVAVHYGPQRDTFLSGVVVGDGRLVLTEAAPLEGAEEISIAFTDGEVLDGEAQPAVRGALLGGVSLPGPHGASAELVPDNPALAGDLGAFAAGAPESFQAAQVAVHLHPLREAGTQLRWQVTPALPAFYRGGPLLDARGRLLGMLVLEPAGKTLVGIPVAAFRDLVGPQAQVPGSPAADQPPFPSPQVPPLQLPLRPGPAGSAWKAAPAPTPPMAVEPRPAIASIDLPLPVPATGWVWKPAAPPPVSAVVPSSSAPVEEAGDDVLRRVTQANRQSQQRSYAGAVATLEEALRLHPDQTVLYYHLAFAYWSQALHDAHGRSRNSMERSSYRKAVKAFETFLARARPGDPRLAEARIRLELLRSAQFGYRPKR